MIELTRLNGNPMLLNSDLIKTAEASPDTMLTLINGEKLIVREESKPKCLKGCSRTVQNFACRQLRASLSPDDALRRAASLTSLEFAGEIDPAAIHPTSSRRRRRPMKSHHTRSGLLRSSRWTREASAESSWPIAGIIAGLLIEGGKISQILQPTAALIVFGGTWEQCCFSSPSARSPAHSAAWLMYSSLRRSRTKS